MDEARKELATTTALNAKINKVKNKIPNFTNLTATAALTAVKKIKCLLVIQSTKLTITQKLVKWEIKLLLIMIMINILLPNNLIS